MTDNTVCPVCGEEEVTELYVDRESLKTLGCDACMRALTPEEALPWAKEDDYLYCPVCGSRCDDLYIDKYTGNVIGCDDCVQVVEALKWEVLYNNERSD